jgi:phage gpG-like protein
VTIKVNISDALTPALDKLGRDFGVGTQELMMDIAVDMRDMVQEAMLNPSSRPSSWSPLTKKYANWKGLKVGRTTADLVLSGRLYQSITPRINSPTESEVFTNVPYAEVHQEGGGNNVPARPYFPVLGGRLTPYAEQRIYSIIDGWITRKLG